MNTQEQLTLFREKFTLTKCYVEIDWITYRTRRGLAKAVAEDANKLIDELGLGLIATVPNSVSQDTVLIQHQWMQI